MKNVNRKALSSIAIAGAVILAMSACTVSPAASPTPKAEVTFDGGTSSTGAPTYPAKTAMPNPAMGALGTSTMDAARFQASPIYGNTQQSGIWVSGFGRVSAKPDIGMLNFGVESRGDTVAAARDKATKAMDAALKALRDRKVADKDIQTQNYSIYPIMVYNDQKINPQPQIVGYQVTNYAVAKIRDLDAFGGIIDAVAVAGGDEVRIHGISFTIDNPKPLEAQARESALKDAIAKAQQIAKVTGVTLGAPTFISESGGSPIVVQKEYARAGGAPAAMDISTPISPGESQVDMQVQVVFAIQ